MWRRFSLTHVPFFDFYHMTMTTIEQMIQSSQVNAKDAKYLMAHVLNKDHHYVSANRDLVLSKEQMDRFSALADKWAKGTPLEYLTNRSFFMGLDFYVDRQVLIPRNETEQLVEWVVNHVNQTKAQTVLDMCCGSGCILISVLSLTPSTHGVGVDISKQACEIAVTNAKKNQVDQRTKFVVSDLFAQVNTTFDVIVSNPPYISTVDMLALEPSVADHEPHLALHGGESGLVFYEEIAAQAKSYLNPTGAVFFEIGYNQGAQVNDILKKNGYQNIEVKKDYFGHDRMVRAFL